MSTTKLPGLHVFGTLNSILIQQGVLAGSPTEAVKILQNVGKFLGRKSRKTARLVCRAWKSTFDKFIGVSLQVDDRNANSEDFEEVWKWNFTRYIAIEEATIVSIMNEEGVCLMLHRPHLLRVAKCNGNINPYWLSQNLLLNANNLTQLVLCGRFILSQDLAAMETSSDYQGHLVLPSLKCLHIEVNYQELREQLVQTNDNWMVLELAMMQSLGLAESEVNLNPDSEKHQKLQLMMLRTLLDSNMSLLLKLLRGLQLKALYISIDWLPEFGFESVPFDWKIQPLESFLSAHRKTLRHVYLPRLSGKEKLSHKEYLLPDHLESLELFLLNGYEGEHPSYEYWEKFLVGQESLKELHLDLNIDPKTEWYKGSLLGSMLDQSQTTLTYIQLAISNPNSSLRILDGLIFRNCAALQTLILRDSPEFPSQLINLPLLPKSLHKLQVLSTSVLKIMEWEKLKDFRALEVLDLRRIFRTDHVTDHLKVNRFFKEIVRLPRLNSLKIHFEQALVGEERTKTLVKLLKRLREDPPVSEEEVLYIVMTPAARLLMDHFFELSPVRRADVDPWKYAISQPEPIPTTRLPVTDLLIESNIFQKEAGHLGSLITSMILNS